MTVFKTFFKILKKNILTVVIYTVILIIFGTFNMQNSENQLSFSPSKPNILIINNDVETGITKGLIDYIRQNSEDKEIEENEEARNDALFYREINYIIYIPENFREDFLEGKNPNIEIKSTGDYQASLAEMLLKRYINVASSYRAVFNEEEIIAKTSETLSKKIDVELTSKLEAGNLNKLSFYYNFASYSILAGCMLVICMILASFKSKNISRRTIISSMSYRKYNFKLLIANGVFAIVLWVFYVIISRILFGDMIFKAHGLIFMLNSLVFTICALTIAILIGNIVNSKEAINGIVNVVALGSSFICGAFVPMEWLPEGVLKFAHLLPTYWYIKTNEALKTLEIVNLDTIKPILVNMAVIFGFAILFVFITNIVSASKRRTY
ncbi:MAG: ABC transporter permease [Clostridia bacterium]|nr:ABC transporter permease [Clostridia bacterium]